MDTIAAIATPLGEGGISIIRVSGTSAIDVANKLSNIDLNQIPARKMTLGYVVNKGKKLDQVLWVVMPGPKSYTGEDVVEIHCHGGLKVSELVLEAVIEAGARLAEPGEFSKRAFLNGKIDLAQAEAIIDVIRARTDTSLRVAFRALEGELSETIEEIRDKLLKILATLEASIDYPDDVDEPDVDDLQNQMIKMHEDIDALIASFIKGKSLREGYLVAIVGRPNVGKSSLLNQLAKEERAIVTDIPGTTRDVVEVEINVSGVSVIFADTAGLRETDDPVESIGVGKSREYVKKSDLCLWVIDSSEPLTDEDYRIAELLKDKSVLILLNKQDKPSKVDATDLATLNLESKLLPISLTEGTGVNEFMLELEKQIGFSGYETMEEVLVTRVRHKKALEKARMSLEYAIENVASAPLDLLTVDLRQAYSALGEITGHVVTEDILDRIFEEFCLGK
ncbi:MAG TPA: tRNA uridine-5-carboxymethylaminomethyl(34) synthesis GTPase MnmE [Firmicutes bacterium]|jgi:tRNA modification GTPase|nr:tRNA uridine-5-carboxymethylaminomethyl(34) synthesis GTPase MnmE [Bacillota bacterium]